MQGEELKLLYKKQIKKALLRLCNALSQLWYCKDQPGEEALDVEEAVIRAVIADGNYQHFYIVLSMIFAERAKIAMRKGDHDAAVKAVAAQKLFAPLSDRSDYQEILA